MPAMDPGCATFLCSSAGAALLEAAREARPLALHRRAPALAGQGTPQEIRWALAQDDLRCRARERCPHAERLLFTPEALEQASAWAVAAERAERWQAAEDVGLTDLGAGIGLDTLAAALTGRPVVAFERDAARAALLAHNARALGVARLVEVRGEDAVTAAPSGVLAYFDPDRRAEGVRTRDPAAFEPPRSGWDALLGRFERSLVKLPPVLEGHRDLDGPQEVVSLGGRARERRLFVGAWPGVPALRALALPSGRSIAGEGLPWPDVRSPQEGDWLLDPDVSVTLAGLVGDLALRDHLRAAHPEVPYLVGAEPNDVAPGHWMQIAAVLPTKPKALNAWLRAHDVGAVTIRKRGIEEQAAAWRKKLKPKGRAAATLVFTRDVRDKWVVYACLD